MQRFEADVRAYLIPDAVVRGMEEEGVSEEALRAVLAHPLTVGSTGRPPRRLVLRGTVEGLFVYVEVEATASWKQWRVVRAWRESPREQPREYGGPPVPDA